MGKKPQSLTATPKANYMHEEKYYAPTKSSRGGGFRPSSDKAVDFSKATTPAAPLGFGNRRDTAQPNYRPPPSQSVKTPGTFMGGLPSDAVQGIAGIAQTSLMVLGDFGTEYAVCQRLKDLCDKVQPVLKKPSLEVIGAVVWIHVRVGMEQEVYTPRRVGGAGFVAYASDPRPIVEEEMKKEFLLEGDEGWADIYFYLWITPKLCASRQYTSFPIVGRKVYEARFRRSLLDRLLDNINDVLKH